MGIIINQNIRLNQSVVMTPHLQMAIKLLQLSRLDLLDIVNHELEVNPALDEVVDTISSEEQSGQSDDSEKEITIEDKLPDDIDWSNYLDEYNAVDKTSFESEWRDSPRFESFIANKESLIDHLLWQLIMTSPTEEEKQIGTLIIGNLDKDGYLDIPTQEIAKLSEASLQKTEQILSLLQTFDPVGICARDVRECLLIQAQRLGFDEDSVVTTIIENYLPQLENNNYEEISEDLEADLDEILFAVNIIKSFEPRPGRQFNDETPQYIEPDIYVYQWGSDFTVVINDDGMPRLRVNPFYQDVVERDDKISENAKEYMLEKLRSAAWLIKSIHQRQRTIYRVMESILRFQRDFFEKGINHLKPMVLRDVADDINMHESTISRVTTNKYVYTPQGIFELKYFFNSSINRFRGTQGISSTIVSERIKQIIEKEDPRKPYSDDKIAKLLKKSNIDIARRTVAKYRETMKILPSNKRKQV